MVSPPCDANCNSYYMNQQLKQSNGGKSPSPLAIRSLYDDVYTQQAVWARSAATSLFDNNGLHARSAVPEFFTDANGQVFYKRDPDADRFGIRGLLKERDELGGVLDARWAEANAAHEAREAALAEKDLLERRWMALTVALEARSDVLIERGLDGEDPGVW